MKVKNNMILCVGEVLWDHLPTGKMPGGAPMNVALHLHQLGQMVTFASRVGEDPSGQELRAFLAASGLDTSLIDADPVLPTSKVLVHLDENNNATYEICAPVAWDNLRLSPALVKAAAAAGIIIFGTLASRNSVSRGTLLELLKGDALRVIDINLRKPYDRQEVAELLLARADVAKLNSEELETIASWHGRDTGDEKENILWFAEHYVMKVVCVTRGSRGAIVWDNGRFYEHQGYRVRAVDTVGAGDAFLAGWLASLLAGKEASEALAFACATGAFVATQPGATPNLDMRQITSIRNGDCF